MSAERRPEIYFTEREYFQFENESASKHEYYAGQIYAMAGASPRHNDISMSASIALGIQLRGRPCIPRGADQRLKVEANGLIAYPDVMVVCPPLRYDPLDANTLVDATVIVEVLSPSTTNYDRGNTFAFYRELPGLRHYVLIAQDRMEVEHRWLDARSGTWESSTLTESSDMVRLSAVECILMLSELYERVEF